MNRTPATTIAKQRLAEKQAEVQKQVELTAVFLENLKTKDDALSSSFSKQRERLHNQFLALHNALNAKENELLTTMKVEFETRRGCNEELISAAENQMDKAVKVLKEPDIVHQEGSDTEFVRQCSTTSQLLEESFLEMLLLSNANDVSDDDNPVEKGVDVTGIIRSVENLQLVELTESRDLLDREHVVQPSLKLSNEADVASHPESLSTVEHIKNLLGQQLDVMVTSVEDPTNICAQPYGEELVELMKRMGDFYKDLVEDGDCGELFTAPQVGDFCCAQFTQDDCWYRAVVIAVDTICTTQGGCAVDIPDAFVMVQYVDYGNQEQLPLSRLRVLDPSFRSLPRQALSCYLAGVEPLIQPQSNKSESEQTQAQEGWSPQVSQWLGELLLGRKVEVLILSEEVDNRLGVDMLIPTEWLFTDELLANFPMTVQSIPIFPRLGDRTSTVRLSSFLYSAGLAKSTLCLPYVIPYIQPLSPPTFAPARHSPCSPQSPLVVDQTVDTRGSSPYVTPYIQTLSPPNDAPARHLSCSPQSPLVVDQTVDTRGSSPMLLNKDGLITEENTIPSAEVESRIVSKQFGPPTTSSLKPLSVKLDASLAFGLLVSHVVSPWEFYVHPIQEDVASSVLSLPESLSTYYSISSNQHHLSLAHSEVSDRVLCCVHCPDDNLWYRGVISPLIQNSTTCSVQLLDFGEELLVPLDKVYELDREFCESPAQAICCKLNGLELPIDDPADGSVSKIGSSLSENTDLDISRKNSSSVCKKSELCKSFNESIADKQLIASIRDTVVVGDSTSSEILVEYGSVLSVDLIDTSGETDANINEYLLQQLSSTTSTDPQGLGEWNPMEKDYLTQRNNYKIDDEDAGLALYGYRSTNRPCRFYRSKKGCVRGDNCQFLHLDEGISDKQLEEVYMSPDNTVPLPAVNAVVVVIVTATVSAIKFYVQMPLGKRSALQKPSSKQGNDGMDLNEVYSDMLNEMTAYYDKKVFSERMVVKAEVGEIVAVRYDGDNQWYRARVIDSSYPGKTKVFYVDYGHHALVCDEEIREMKPEFMIVPFQAIECYLPGLCHPQSATNVDKMKAKECFDNLVTGQVLVAKVVTKLSNVVLGLELYSDVHINKKLVEQGHLTRSTGITRAKDLVRSSEYDSLAESLYVPG